ncbi:matrix remodeling-associated protein 8b [Pangasianodon hypophthalmus]|uniref:matrix remodeling-associated protein 8b n=1 Tax=Pangasianodon hypophthalmus TaxID=310915 RepID=UPI0023079BEA|nr:matrix remodeling-associated protein 8b [Pangasianodon hypophthalmus]
MKDPSRVLCEMVGIFFMAAAFLTPHVWAQVNTQSIVVEARNMTVSEGSTVVLPCHNQKIVWRQDHLRDRQRVVHWDLNRNRPDYRVERVLDMFSGGTERVYNAYNKGRVTVSKEAFNDGNFSLTINNVDMNDKGTYTCNLHHHYCKIDKSIQIQLNVTKSPRKERRFFDGEKSVFVVLEGSSVVLPCINRHPLWRGGLQEDRQQVVHWDFQGPGVRRDQADRLLDLYASGEKREYRPLYLSKMHISSDAFSMGDFSLTINDIQPSDKGLYSCHLHHHYCGLHERRIFRVIVGPPVLPVAAPTEALTTQPAHTETTQTPQVMDNDRDINKVEASHVFNVILPESQSHLIHQAGYILAFFLLLLLMLIGIIMTTRHCKKKGLEYDIRRADRSHRMEIEMQATELRPFNQEVQLDYKNNIMKERVEMNNYCAPKEIDLNREMEKFSRK